MNLVSPALVVINQLFPLISSLGAFKNSATFPAIKATGVHLEVSASGIDLRLASVSKTSLKTEIFNNSIIVCLR